MMRAYPERSACRSWRLLLHFCCFANKNSERCPRGRRGSPAKGVSGQKPDRGFESLSLRQLCVDVIATTKDNSRLASTFYNSFNAPVAQLVETRARRDASGIARERRGGGMDADWTFAPWMVRSTRVSMRSLFS